MFATIDGPGGRHIRILAELEDVEYVVVGLSREQDKLADRYIILPSVDLGRQLACSLRSSRLKAITGAFQHFQLSSTGSRIPTEYARILLRTSLTSDDQAVYLTYSRIRIEVWTTRFTLGQNSVISSELISSFDYINVNDCK